MNEQSQYWYFRFKKEFVLGNKLQRIKDAYEDGHKIAFIYMELCGIAIDCKGEFFLDNVGPDMFSNKIASRINETPEMTSKALHVLQKYGIVSVEYKYEDAIVASGLVIPDLQNNIGRSSKVADAQRIRDRKKNEVPLEVSQAKQLMQQEKSAYGYYQNVMLTREEYMSLEEECGNTKAIIEKLSFLLEKEQIDPNSFKAYEFIHCEKCKAKKSDQGSYEDILNYLEEVGEEREK